MRVRIMLIRGHEFVHERLLESARTVVGRDPACDVVVDDIAVSKRHARLHLSEAGLELEDLGSLNGTRVNGLAVQRQLLRHLDVIEIGSHKMHVFDEALLPQSGLNPEATLNPDGPGLRDEPPRASPLGETQPGTTVPAVGPVYALRRMDEEIAGIAPLDQVRTVVGEPGKAALIVRRRDKLLLTKLSRAPLNVNGHEVDGASVAVDEGDIIDVGAVRYQLVRLG
jgi:hypothetical protein